MSYRDHLDYLPLDPGGPIGVHSATRPPCNEIFSTTAAVYALTATAIASSVASSVISYQSSENAAKQAEYNADAQKKAIIEERRRQAAQESENQRRAAQEQRRIRAVQLNAMAGSGAMLGTGTPLALEADTWAKQQIELADQQRTADLAQRQLAYEGYTVGILGSQQAAQHRRDATGAIISGIGSVAGSAYGAFSTRPQTAPNAYNYRTRQPMAGSTNI
jgi:hypothetical protein